MIIRGIRLRLATERGNFGFNFLFGRNLTIVRAGNSCGKSTLVNALLYGLGMEELLGGRGAKALPYAVKDYIEYEDHKILISASEVWTEIENSAGQVVTLRRAIRDQVRDGKLIDIFDVAYLTNGEELGEAKSTYLHDSGGARRPEGFHKFLENFLDLALPMVATTGAVECKLYLQTIFAALAVEQKRGWTDYIASIPFFGIRDARRRVVEFLLGLDVFKINAERNRLGAESLDIEAEWYKYFSDLRRESHARGMEINGLSSNPSAIFDGATILINRIGNVPKVSLDEYMVQLRNEHQSLTERARAVNEATGEAMLEEIESAAGELQELNVLYERVSSAHGLHQASLKEYEQLFQEAQEDLERNKAAIKLGELGAKFDVNTARGQCPTCHQAIEDSLLIESVSGPQMDLAMNVGYLESQIRMLKRQIVGLKESIRESEARMENLSAQLSAKYDYLTALRGGISSGTSESKAVIRRQVQIEVEMESLDVFSQLLGKTIERLERLANRFAKNQVARRSLPQHVYSSRDEVRISVFEKNFRANAGSFGYESAPVQDIEISRDNLIPSLSQLELREIRTDIKADSSASDFVRLIWSYLLALYQTSDQPSMPGNHPGVILFDEPGQHSMAVDSQRALLQQLCSEMNLQSIVAASFDEMETVFQEVTSGVPHKLIQWDGKLIKPLSY